MAKIALLCSNNTQLGHGSHRDHKTGASLLEIAPIVHELERGDHRVELFSPVGGAIPLDPSTLDFSNPIVRDYYERKTFLRRLENALPFEEIIKESYDALVVCGGWNGAGELATKLSVGDLILMREFRKIALIGYSTSLLLQPNIAKKFKGEKVTGPTLQEDEDIGFNKFWPMTLSHDLVAAGYEYMSSKAWSRNIMESGPLLTGQNVFSAQAVAEVLMVRLHQGV